VSLPAAIYHQRNPQDSDYYRCVEDYCETFVQIYDDHFSRQYGFWRPYLEKVIYRYLDCGDMHNGFARVKCKNWGHEYLLALSCKRHHFCPSYHQKRVVEFSEWVCTDVLKKIPHRYPGFNVFCGNRISPRDETAMENLARYIIRASFSQERMVRYYGYYSNVSRGKRKEAGADDVIPCILEPQGNSKTFRRSWARLIEKIYEVDPLVCPRCRGTMRIISFIEDRQVIRAILEHLGL